MVVKVNTFEENMATSNVVNPTNAPYRKDQALPFIRRENQSQIVSSEKKPKNPFNDGRDYPDEGAPLLTGSGDEKTSKRFAPHGVMINPLGAPTNQDWKELYKPDETSQTQISYLKEAIIMDVDAKLITSTVSQMKNGHFREAHFPTMKDYLKSEHYKKLRESKVIADTMGKHVTKLRESNKATIAGVRLNPQLVTAMHAADRGILSDFNKSKLGQEMKKFRETIEIKSGKRLKESNFTLDTQGPGSWGGDVVHSGSGTFDSGGVRDSDYVPLMSGPWSKQLYWFDYLDMHSKAWEASTHNPVAKRILKVITQFVLGKGVKLTVVKAIKKSDKDKADKESKEARMEAQKKAQTPQPVPQPPPTLPPAQQTEPTEDQGQQQPPAPQGQQPQEPGQQMQKVDTRAGTAMIVEDFKVEAQEVLDTHWMKNGLHIRSKQILHDLLTFGEQFIRYFDAPWGLKIRAIDPSTVYEVITDPDDCENEFYIHQQYSTRYQTFGLMDMGNVNVPMMKFIIRQVPAAHYFHMKINSTAGEVRGRSELFAILGWLKRLKEFASDRVIRNKMANLFVLDVSVDGDAASVALIQQQLTATPPSPGAFFFHNKAAELQGVKAEVGASDSQGDWQMLMTIIAMGAGISQEYLGMGAQGGKAGALLGTEPDIKTFEDHQEMMEQFFDQDAERVFQRAKERKLLPLDLMCTIEATYPSLAEENRSEKLKDLAFGESMSWWSHRRIAAAASKEMQFTSYNYDDEQKAIAEEDVQKEVLINTAYGQILKGQDPSASAGAPASPGGGGPSSANSGASGEIKMSKMGSGDSSFGGGDAPDVAGSQESGFREGYERSSTVSGRHSTVEAASYLYPNNNKSVNEAGLRKGYVADPRDVASGIKREAANLRFRRRGIIGRKHDKKTPGHKRDQKSKADAITKARKSLRSGNFNHESEKE